MGPEVDEVVDLAAEVIINGKRAQTYHAYLKNTVGVKDTVYIHELTDTFLAEHGRPPKTVLKEFFELAHDALLVGHNVAFDIGMVGGYARRLGLKSPEFKYFDTLDIARRFVTALDHRLGTLVKVLDLPSFDAHRAGDDARATTDLLFALRPLWEAKSRRRAALVNKHGKGFVELAEQLDQWRAASQARRPADQLRRILVESGLDSYYGREPERLANLSQLLRLFAERDDQNLPPQAALRALVEFAALSRNVDHLSENDNQVLIITVHQAKGLEFDTVFIAGAVDGEIPHYYSVRDGRLEEERRFST